MGEHVSQNSSYGLYSRIVVIVRRSPKLCDRRSWSSSSESNRAYLLLADSDDDDVEGCAGCSTDGSVALETNLGSIVCELYWDHAPKTCHNFYELAQKGYYTGTIFHRVIPGFMIQGGDPTGTGRGGTSVYGKKFEDEIHPELHFTGAGILAMANSGPNTNGSQFFISLAPTPHLDGKHTIFGRISSGMRIVERLGAIRTDAQDRPLEEVKITKSRIVKTEQEDVI